MNIVTISKQHWWYTCWQMSEPVSGMVGGVGGNAIARQQQSPLTKLLKECSVLVSDCSSREMANLDSQGLVNMRGRGVLAFLFLDNFEHSRVFVW
jgi:hypothetical protein